MTIWYTKIVSSQRNTPYRKYGAIGKSRQDAYQYFDEINARAMPLFEYDWDDEPNDSLNARFDGIMSAVKKGDTIIQLYPHLHNSPVYNEKFFQKANFFGAKVVGYVHDIEFFRHNIDNFGQESGNDSMWRMPHEYDLAKNYINKYDGLIVPTANIKELIQHDLEFSGPIAVAGPYGYVTPMIPDRRELTNEIVFAGSFDKNPSLNEIVKKTTSLQFNVYGKADYENNQVQNRENVKLMGSFDPDALLMSLKGSFGLVWDSIEYPIVKGGVGTYQRVNGPFKFSMYVAAELPPIVWSKMGFADYVVKNDIGWVLDDLTQLEELVNNISEEEYAQKLDNLQQVGNIIRSGEGLKRATFEVVTQLHENPTFQETSMSLEEINLGLDRWIIELDKQHSSDIASYDFPELITSYYERNLYDNRNYQQAREILIKYNKLS